MRKSTSLWLTLVYSLAIVQAACPFMTGELQKRNNGGDDGGKLPGDDGFFDQFVRDDGPDSVMTTEFGTPVDDRTSLKIGARGPTVMEDFVFRRKLAHFDRERIPERVVHARGAGAHGYFESYADWSNISAASFLSEAGKKTPLFLRFSTVAGFRGSTDLARDVHGFALRLYTDEGNYDIVGNAIPVFFIQDAIQFPDLIHSVKPEPDREMPQAATAHNTAWDFFSSNPSAMHTLFWALSGNGIPRSFRHLNGFGVNTFRFVTADGRSKLVKIHFTSQQGLASLTWPEAQAIGGKNADFHRQDLWDNIESGNFPSWEMGVQLVDEEDVRSFGIDLLDPTKILPVELVPITPIGKFTLNRNPRNYFAETEQSMFCPGNIVRGIDFSDDPLLQGRLFSYVDTHVHRAFGSPNFQDIPINRPHSPVHNNMRDGASQYNIFTNNYAYVANALNNDAPHPANQTQNNGFFTSPSRVVPTAHFLREVSPTFLDFYSQPRLFYNSLSPAEQQMLINAARFELANVKSEEVRMNALKQFNRIDNDVANRVAAAFGIPPLQPDPMYYHDNKTTGVSTFNHGPLPTIAGFKVGILATNSNADSLGQAKQLASAFSAKGLVPVVVAEVITDGVNTSYSAADAVLFDAIVVTDNTGDLFTKGSALFPVGRPNQIVRDAFNYGKPVAAIGNGKVGFDSFASPDQDGVYFCDSADPLVGKIEQGLYTFKFTDRFPMDPPSQ